MARVTDEKPTASPHETALQALAGARAAPRKYSVVIAGHATSVTLEPDFWRILKQIARDQGKSRMALITEIDEARSANLSSAIRLYVLTHLSS